MITHRKPVTLALLTLMHPIVTEALATRAIPVCIISRGMWSRYMIEMGESPNAMPCAQRGVLGAAVMLVDGDSDECDGLVCQTSA